MKTAFAAIVASALLVSGTPIPHGSMYNYGNTMPIAGYSWYSHYRPAMPAIHYYPVQGAPIQQTTVRVHAQPDYIASAPGPIQYQETNVLTQPAPAAVGYAMPMLAAPVESNKLTDMKQAIAGRLDQVNMTNQKNALRDQYNSIEPETESNGSENDSNGSENGSNGSENDSNGSSSNNMVKRSGSKLTGPVPYYQQTAPIQQTSVLVRTPRRKLIRPGRQVQRTTVLLASPPPPPAPVQLQDVTVVTPPPPIAPPAVQTQDVTVVAPPAPIAPPPVQTQDVTVVSPPAPIAPPPEQYQDVAVMAMPSKDVAPAPFQDQESTVIAQAPTYEAPAPDQTQDTSVLATSPSSYESQTGFDQEAMPALDYAQPAYVSPLQTAGIQAPSAGIAQTSNQGYLPNINTLSNANANQIVQN